MFSPEETVPASLLFQFWISMFCTVHTRGPFFQQADRAARQKHLHGLDLFLESARAQLKMLMEDQREEDPGD